MDGRPSLFATGVRHDAWSLMESVVNGTLAHLQRSGPAPIFFILRPFDLRGFLVLLATAFRSVYGRHMNLQMRKIIMENPNIMPTRLSILSRL